MSQKAKRRIAGFFYITAMVTVSPPTVLASAATPDVRVQGRVLDAKTMEPVAGAMIFVRSWRSITNAEGRFHIDLPPGNWTLEAVAAKHQTSSINVEVCANCSPEVEILLIPERFIEERVEVSASANGGSDVIATTPVRPFEVLNVAGAFENVFRVLHTMPGVTATDEIGSRMSVRGGGPDQNMTVMDGVEIHNPYRLWGIVSAFNPETVERFELSTGAFFGKVRRPALLDSHDRQPHRKNQLSHDGLSGTEPDGRQRHPRRTPAKKRGIVAHHRPSHMVRPHRRAFHR